MRRVTPLSRSRSVYKNDVERRFLESWDEMAKWLWRSRSMSPVFNTSQKNIKMHIWCKLVILAQILYTLLRRQTKFPRILSQNGQNDPEGQGQRPLYSIPAESIPWCMFGANLVFPTQICDESSCRQDKVYGRTDRQAVRRTDRQYPLGLKGQGVKCIWKCRPQNIGQSVYTPMC